MTTENKVTLFIATHNKTGLKYFAKKYDIYHILKCMIIENILRKDIATISQGLLSFRVLGDNNKSKGNLKRFNNEYLEGLYVKENTNLIGYSRLTKKELKDLLFAPKNYLN